MENEEDKQALESLKQDKVKRDAEEESKRKALEAATGYSNIDIVRGERRVEP